MSIPINQVVVQPPQNLANQVANYSFAELEEFESFDFAGFAELEIDQDFSEYLLGATVDAEAEQVLSLIELATSVSTTDEFDLNAAELDSLVRLPLDLESAVSEHSTIENVPDELVHVAHVSTQTSIGDSGVSSLAEGNMVTHQTVRAVQTEFVSFRQVPSQNLTIEINPPELGKIHIQVEMVADQLTAHIVASEYVSAELLSQQKHLLLDTLSDFGVGDASVSIFHGELNRENGGDDNNGDDSTESLAEIQLDAAEIESQKSTILVGLNLVA